MDDHKKLTDNLRLVGYFADPHFPWQRGSNEHINGMLRRWLQKGADFSPYAQEELNKMAENTNTIPRRTLNLQISKEVFVVFSNGFYRRSGGSPASSGLCSPFL